jgi:hypothetical protein
LIYGSTVSIPPTLSQIANKKVKNNAGKKTVEIFIQIELDMEIYWSDDDD